MGLRFGSSQYSSVTVRLDHFNLLDRIGVGVSWRSAQASRGRRTRQLPLSPKAMRRCRRGARIPMQLLERFEHLAIGIIRISPADSKGRRRARLRRSRAARRARPARPPTGEIRPGTTSRRRTPRPQASICEPFVAVCARRRHIRTARACRSRAWAAESGS